MNIYIFNGTLGNDAEIKNFDNRIAINFNVAVLKKWIDKSGEKKEKTTWIRCTKWVSVGNSTKVADYLKKGTKVVIQGEPVSKFYINSEGKTMPQLECIVDELNIVGWPKSEGQNNEINGDGLPF